MSRVKWVIDGHALPSRVHDSGCYTTEESAVRKRANSSLVCNLPTIVISADESLSCREHYNDIDFTLKFKKWTVLDHTFYPVLQK
jgi:hypothetical protein